MHWLQDVLVGPRPRAGRSWAMAKPSHVLVKSALDHLEPQFQVEQLTLAVCFIMLQDAFLSLASPAEMMHIAVVQVFLLVGRVALVALCPPAKPINNSTSVTSSILK